MSQHVVGFVHFVLMIIVLLTPFYMMMIILHPERLTWLPGFVRIIRRPTGQYSLRYGWHPPYTYEGYENNYDRIVDRYNDITNQHVVVGKYGVTETAKPPSESEL